MKTYRVLPEKLGRVFASLLAVCGVSTVCLTFCLAPGFLQAGGMVLESACRPAPLAVGVLLGAQNSFLQCFPASCWDLYISH